MPTDGADIFVGRDREIALLEDKLDLSSLGKRQIVSVSGYPASAQPGYSRDLSNAVRPTASTSLLDDVVRWPVHRRSGRGSTPLQTPLAKTHRWYPTPRHCGPQCVFRTAWGCSISPLRVRFKLALSVRNRFSNTDRVGGHSLG